MLNTDKEILEQAKGVAVEVYKDAMSPVVKPIGEILGFLPRTIKLALSGWEKWLINGEESLKLTAEAIKEKVQQIPKEKLVEPEPYVAIPAIQQISYCQNSAELRDLYANLLTSSMNVDKKWQVHPSFVDIIKQLNPDEAKYLKALTPSIIILYPLVDKYFKLGNNKGRHPIISNFTDENIKILEHPENICEYIDNFLRLKLIEIPDGELSDKEPYKTIENHPLIQNPVKFHSSNSRTAITYTIKRKMFRLTNFGVNFIKVVCTET
jgi:hypothetical protein